VGRGQTRTQKKKRKLNLYFIKTQKKTTFEEAGSEGRRDRTARRVLVPELKKKIETK